MPQPFSQFFNSVIDAFAECMKPLIEQDSDAIGKNLINHAFNLDEKQEINREFDAYQQFMSKLFYGLAEIVKSRDTLTDVEFYVNRFPFSRTRITPEQYLQFHVEVYYSELYILRERLSKYVTFLERQYLRDSRLPNVKTVFKAINELVTRTLNGAINVRSAHVHETRFVDDGIDRLSTLGLLMRSKDNKLAEIMTKQYRAEHRKVKRLWHNRIAKNNQAVVQLLDHVCEALLAVVFQDDGTMRIPSGVRLKNNCSSG